MSGLSIDQLPYLRGLRGLGGAQEDCLEALEWCATPEARAMPWTKDNRRSRECGSLGAKRAECNKLSSDSSARAAVDRSNEQNEQVQQTIDRSQTFIEATRIAERPQRVSPLAVSWRFGLQPGAPALDPYRRGGISMGWVLVGAAVLLGGGALYLAFRKE